MMNDNNKTGFDGGSQQLNNGYKIDAAAAAAAADGSGVECGICLDLVTEDGKRAWAKLQCNHQFHLDCIGSAFNAKGVMECPNCRKVEQGQWLFPNGRANPIPVESFHDDIDEWYPDLHMELLDLPDLSGLFSLGSSSSLLMFPLEEPESIPLEHQSSRRRRSHRRSRDEQQRATPVSNHNSAMRSVTTPPATRLTTHPNSSQRNRERVEAQPYRQQSSNPASTRASLGSSRSRYNNSQNNTASTRASFGSFESRYNNSRNNLASTRTSFGAYGSRYNNSQNNLASTQASFGSFESRYNNIRNNLASTRASFGAYGSRYNNSQNNNTRIRNLPPIPYLSNHAAPNHLQANSSAGRYYYHLEEQVHDEYEYYEPPVVRPQSMRRRRSGFEGSRHSQNQGRF